MSNFQLIRKYRLVVGETPDNTITSEVDSEADVEGLTELDNVDDYRTITTDAIEITSLQLVADIKSSTDSSLSGGNTSTFQIFNANDETREKLEKANSYIIFEAGWSYDEELPMLYSGQIIDAFTSRRGLNVITTLVCQDGGIASSGVRVSKDYPEGSTLGSVINDLASIYERSGISRGVIVTNTSSDKRFHYLQVKNPDEISLEEGYSVSGYLSEELDKVVAQCGYVAYVTSGRLFIHPKEYPEAVEEFEITAKHMRSVRPKSGKRTTTTSESKKSILLEMDLDARIDIDKRINVTEGLYAGTYKIENRNVKLDYRDGGWMMILEGIKVD